MSLRVGVLLLCLAAVAGTAPSVAAQQPAALVTVDSVEAGVRPSLVQAQMASRFDSLHTASLRSASCSSTVPVSRSRSSACGLRCLLTASFSKSARGLCHGIPPQCPPRASCPGFGFPLVLTASAPPPPLRPAGGGARLGSSWTTRSRPAPCCHCRRRPSNSKSPIAEPQDRLRLSSFLLAGTLCTYGCP